MKPNAWRIKEKLIKHTINCTYIYIHSIQGDEIIYDYIICFVNGRIEYTKLHSYSYNEFIKHPGKGISFNDIPREIITALAPAQIAQYRIQDGKFKIK